MSLILEALRKSEAERRRGLAPDVAMELPPALMSRPRSLATWLLPALAAAVALTLAGWWFTREPARPLSQATVIERTDASPAQDPTVPVLTPRMQPRPGTPEIEIAPALRAPVAPLPASVAVPPSKPASASPAAAAGIAVARPVATQPVPHEPTASRLPLPVPANDISDDTSGLPPVKLSMHMWDDVPSKRFVIINGQRMAEGDRQGGVTVVAIERAGVVVESNGSRARVPLP